MIIKLLITSSLLSKNIDIDLDEEDEETIQEQITEYTDDLYSDIDKLFDLIKRQGN